MKKKSLLLKKYTTDEIDEIVIDHIFNKHFQRWNKYYRLPHHIKEVIIHYLKHFRYLFCVVNGSDCFQYFVNALEMFANLDKKDENSNLHLNENHFISMDHNQYLTLKWREFRMEILLSCNRLDSLDFGGTFFSSNQEIAAYSDRKAFYATWNRFLESSTDLQQVLQKHDISYSYSHDTSPGETYFDECNTDLLVAIANKFNPCKFETYYAIQASKMFKQWPILFDVHRSNQSDGDVRDVDVMLPSQIVYNQLQLSHKLSKNVNIYSKMNDIDNYVKVDELQVNFSLLFEMMTGHPFSLQIDANKTEITIAGGDGPLKHLCNQIYKELSGRNGSSFGLMETLPFKLTKAKFDSVLELLDQIVKQPESSLTLSLLMGINISA